MTITKRIGASAHDYRPKTAREIRQVLRPGRVDRVVRWIGAGKRRPAKRLGDAGPEASGADIIRLSWADTFGRPACLAVTGYGRAGARDVQVLPFQGRPNVEAAPPATRWTADQPPVPVLR